MVSSVELSWGFLVGEKYGNNYSEPGCSQSQNISVAMPCRVSRYSWRSCQLAQTTSEMSCALVGRAVGLSV